MEKVAAVGALAAIAFFSAAAAQQTAPPEGGLGPYHFGMTLADAEATSQRASWHTEWRAGVGRVLTGGPQLQVGGTRLGSAFVFDNDALRFIILSGQTSASCGDSVRALIENDLEPSFGLFSSAPGPQEQGRPSGVVITARGSEIRDLSDERGPHVASSRRGDMFIEVDGAVATAGAGCVVSVTFNAATPYGGPILAPITYEELDRAQTLVNPRWIERPGVRAFEQNYPRAAFGTEGRVVLDCLVNDDGSLRCLIAMEAPADRHFGEAALHIAQDFRVRESIDGVAAAGKRVRVPITFRTR